MFALLDYLFAVFGGYLKLSVDNWKYKSNDFYQFNFAKYSFVFETLPICLQGNGNRSHLFKTEENDARHSEIIWADQSMFTQKK